MGYTDSSRLETSDGNPRWETEITFGKDEASKIQRFKKDLL